MKYLSMVTVVLAGAAAALAQLPYPWAHSAALAVSAGIAGLHLQNIGPSGPKGGSQS